MSWTRKLFLRLGSFAERLPLNKHSSTIQHRLWQTAAWHRQTDWTTLTSLKNAGPAGRCSRALYWGSRSANADANARERAVAFRGDGEFLNQDHLPSESGLCRFKSVCGSCSLMTLMTPVRPLSKRGCSNGAGLLSTGHRTMVVERWPWFRIPRTLHTGFW